MHHGADYNLYPARSEFVTVVLAGYTAYVARLPKYQSKVDGDSLTEIVSNAYSKGNNYGGVGPYTLEPLATKVGPSNPIKNQSRKKCLNTNLIFNIKKIKT